MKIIYFAKITISSREVIHIFYDPYYCNCFRGLNPAVTSVSMTTALHIEQRIYFFPFYASDPREQVAGGRGLALPGHRVPVAAHAAGPGRGRVGRLPAAGDHGQRGEGPGEAEGAGHRGRPARIPHRAEGAEPDHRILQDPPPQVTLSIPCMFLGSRLTFFYPRCVFQRVFFCLKAVFLESTFKDRLRDKKKKEKKRKKELAPQKNLKKVEKCYFSGKKVCRVRVLNEGNLVSSVLGKLPDQITGSS